MSDDDDFQRWARDIRDELIPKLADSAAVVSLVPTGETDIKFAVELGLAIMMDKPIIAVVKPGTKVPAKLLAVADRIVEADLTPEGSKSARDRIGKAVMDLLNEADQ